MQQEQNLGGAAQPTSQAPAPVSVASQPVESAPAQPARATYSEDQQAHLNSLIGAAKKEGYEKALRERQEQTGHQAPAQPVPSYAPPRQPVQQPAQPYMDPQALQQMVDTAAESKVKSTIAQLEQQFQAKRKQEENTKLLNDLSPKIQAAKQKFADFDEKVDYGVIKEPLYHELAKFDNAGEMIYAFMDQPMQLKALEMMISSGYEGDIKMAKNQLDKLSKSMKNNESSASKKIPNEPLRDVRPSKVNGSGEVNLARAAQQKYAKYF